MASPGQLMCNVWLGVLWEVDAPQHRFCQVWEALDGTRCPLRCDDAGSIDRCRLVGRRTRFLGQKRATQPARSPETNAGKTGPSSCQRAPSGQRRTEHA